MKKIYLLSLNLLLIVFTGAAQFTVSATASNPSICLGGSSTLTATASPVSYAATSISYNMNPALGISELCSNGTEIVTKSAGINLDDCRWDNISLPFTFTFYGNNHNQICVSSNGWINMGSSSTTTTGFNQSIPVSTAANDAIFGMLTDLDFRTVGTIEYFTNGFAPNRVFSVLYSNAGFRSGGGSASIEIMLYEGTNVVEVHTNMITNNTTLNKTQGVENAAGSVAVASPGRNNVANWGAGTTAYRFSPENITYSWSPATGLSSTTGKVVTATPNATTTYTVTATNAASQQATNTVTVTINSNSFVLAGTPGGTSISHNIAVSPTGTYYRDMSNCNLISYILPFGSNPVTNSINNTIKVDAHAWKRGTTNDLYLARKYDIEPVANPATSTAKITLYFLQSEFNNFNARANDSGHRLLPTGPSDATGIANVVLRQFHGTGTAPGNYTGSTENFTTASGLLLNWNATRSWWEAEVTVNGFSGFYITSAKNGTIPVKLIYFTGTISNKTHVLDWKVNCTSTEARFEIERSSNGTQFNKIHEFTASQLRCEQAFNYTINEPASGINYYRLKVIDIDGSFYYTQIVALNNRTKGFELLSLNPNIIRNENAVLRINAGEQINGVLMITDFSGRLISRKTINVQSGINNYTIETAQLKSGTYQLSLLTSETQPQTIRFVKQ